MEQGPDNDLYYESIEEKENDERNGILKKVDGRVRLLKKLDGRVRIVKRSGRGIRSLAARLNGRTKLFGKPIQIFWFV